MTPTPATFTQMGGGEGFGYLPAGTVPDPNPAPGLTSIVPNTATAGGTALTLTVGGTGFISGSVVKWNGSARPTTYVSATQLKAAITRADVAVAGTATVTVFNPAPGGGTSAGLRFTVN